jgi:hypothetical protein
MRNASSYARPSLLGLLQANMDGPELAVVD